MSSVKRAKFRHKTKNPFPPLPLHPRWFKLKLYVKICKIIKICAPFFCILKKSRGQKFECEIFSKWKKNFKKGGTRFWFFTKFYLMLKFETSRMKGKRGKWNFEIAYFGRKLAKSNEKSFYFFHSGTTTYLIMGFKQNLIG